MDNEQSWFALEITVVSEAAEAVEFALNELDALGTEINNLGVNASETLCIIGYFNRLPSDETVRDQLNEALRIYGFSPAAIVKNDSREVVKVDWLAEWKKRWKPTETDKFIIAPTWEKIENSDKTVVYIEPNMAFGTGTHETTRLCLQAIGENYQPRMSFLDVGTGTGILSIAAAKFQVSDFKFQVPDSASETLNPESETLNRFLACDTDAASIEIARENAELNGVRGINFYVGSISDETPSFDFVCANITIDVIAPILPILFGKARKFLILSGILQEQKNLIIAELNKLGVANPKIESLGEWISIVLNIENHIKI